MKRVLIVGKNSYIGESFKKYCEDNYREQLSVKELGSEGLDPKASDMEGFDTVFFVAGIAHIRETEENKHLYYEINRDLCINAAKCAKEAGVRHFVVMSSMAVYGKTEGVINKDTIPEPVTHYGKSKLQADNAILEFRDASFKVAVVRPPMVYGRGCKGNYPKLRKLALKTPLFPKVNNKRSMIYIGNLAEFLAEVIVNEKEGVLHPQNAEYINTSALVKEIAKANGRKMLLLPGFSWIKNLPLKVVKKVFGSLTYEHGADDIRKYDNTESVRLTEGK